MKELFDPAKRKVRSLHILDSSAGLYALYLKPASALPGFDADFDKPLYIGKADGAGGLARRCHFKGGTRNHSPRKSLAALLEKELGLQIRAFRNRTDNSFKTWGLERDSEIALDRWMHANLLLSVVPTLHAAVLEKLLIREWAPPLNLTDCHQSAGHLTVSRLRGEIERRARAISPN